MHIEIQHIHDQHQDRRHHGIDRKGILQDTSYQEAVSPSEMIADNRSQTIRESCRKYDDQIEHIVHEAGGCKLSSTTSSDHHRVGKRQNNNPELPYDDGQPEF